MAADNEQHVQSDRCSTCGTRKEFRDCWNCDEGFTGHDCGEDCCCCLDPEDNVVCDICNGEGGFLVCESCHPSEDV